MQDWMPDLDAWDWPLNSATQRKLANHVQHTQPSATKITHTVRHEPDDEDGSLMLDRVPAKFLQSSYNPSSDSTLSMTHPENKNTGFATAITTAIAPSRSSTAENNAIPGPSPPPNTTYDLPDLPAWLAGLIAGSLTFGLVVAVLLYLANFPPTWRFSEKLRRQRSTGYYPLRDHEHEDSDESDHVTSSSLRRRNKYKNLHVDTTARYTGLGIAVPGDEAPLRLRRRRRSSYDEEALRGRRRGFQTRAQAVWTAVTAPLPSAREFVWGWAPGASGGGGGGRDLETGTHGIQSISSSPGLASPSYRRDYLMTTDREVDFLERVDAGVVSMVGSLATKLDKQVDDAEGGLFLPVRDSEREQSNPDMVRDFP